MALPPVPIHTLVPRHPNVVAATDASKLGMGGFFTLQNPDKSLQNIVWRAPFPSSIQNNLISHSNPQGTITNSNLELCAIIVGAALAASTTFIPHPSILLASDNTPAIGWATKGSTTSSTATAYLLHQLAHTRRATPFNLSPIFTPGDTNQLADCCSRSFHFSDASFLCTIVQKYPVQPPWKLIHPPCSLLSRMNFALFMKLLQLASATIHSVQATPHGTCGLTSAGSSTKIQHWPTCLIQFPFYNYLVNDIGWASLLPVGLTPALERWKEPYQPLARRSLHWDSKTHA
jgi:hypothetical protein